MTDIVVPADLWDTEDEGVLFLWVYPDGARVGNGKLIAEITVEKAQLELTRAGHRTPENSRAAGNHHSQGAGARAHRAPKALGVK